MKQRIFFKCCLFSYFLLLTSLRLTAQGTPIPLNNPSFIDIAHAGGMNSNRGPRGWMNCGAAGETPPDVHPDPEITFGAKGFFEVDKSGQDGNTYLGMVVRDNDTQEAIGQALITPLQAAQCYELSMYLARSEKYMSQISGAQTGLVNHNKPIKIRVYGGNSYCEKAELLDETAPIQHTNWQEYTLKFKPTMQHQYILIQAFYQTPTLFPYCGNVLVDNLSDIIPVKCEEEEELIAAIEKPAEPIIAPKPKEKNPVEESTPKVESPQVETVPLPKKIENSKKDKIISELKGKVEDGKVITLKNLKFGINQSQLNPEAYEELDELVAYMKNYPSIGIEISGHTNDRCDEAYCIKLSQDRAESVASYLIQQGITKGRLISIGYGKKKPIASNRYSAGRRKNQRVEIKILDK